MNKDVGEWLKMRKWFTIPSLLILVLAIGLIGYFLLQASTNSSQLILKELQGQMLKQVSGDLTQRLQEAIQLNQINYDSFNNGVLDLNSEIKRERYFVSHLKAYPYAAMTYVGLTDGSFYGARRTLDGQIQVARNNRTTNGGSWYYKISDLGEGIELVEKFDNFDPRKRPWYVAAESTGAPTFSSVYSHFIYQEPTITYSYPLYNENQLLIGVFGVDYLLSWLGDTLSSLPFGDSGQVFVMDNDRQLIATTAEIPTYQIVDGKSVLISADEIENERIHGALSVSLNADEYLLPQFKIENEKYYVGYSSFKEYGLDWNIYVVSAENDFLLDFKKATSQTFIILAFAMLISIFFTSWIAGRVTKPIKQLSEAAEELMRGRLIPIEDRQRKDELGKLTRSFNSMGEQLTNMLAHLEEEVAERTSELEERNQELSLLSFSDGLTGIANRRKFDEMLLQSWQTEMRYERPVALLMLDIDVFKDYNDFYGHVAGDECLKSIAHYLHTKVRRSSDLAARYGGEEFVVLIQEPEIDKLMDYADEIRQGIEDLKLEHETSPYKFVTVSIGAAYMVPDMNTEPDTLIELADQMLYEAKDRGRNQVAMSWHKDGDTVS